ncbi:MAG: two-component regulator propeller domain-containing protein [Bacteroidota bacterium]|nr:two-component regulator propeller domain-containing protein [Bacteroidota bacterium]
MKINLTFLSTFLFLFQIFGQSDDIIFDHLSIEQGLSHSSVSTIYQDSKGFLWFGTGGGLNKYDGYTFEKYHSYAKDTNSPINNLSNLIFEDRSGVFWLGSDFGYTIYNPNTNTFKKNLTYAVENHIFNFSHIHNIIQDLEGNMWFSQDSALIKLKLSTHTYSKVDFKHGKILKIIMSKEGLFYVGTSNGLYSFNPKSSDAKFESINNILQIKAITLLADKQGILIASKQGIYKYSFAKKKFIKLEYGLKESILDEVKCISNNSENIYIGTIYGLVVCNNGTHNVYTHNISNEGSLSTNTVNCILIDKSGLVWIGTSNGGINIIDKQRHRFRTFKNTPYGYKSLKNVYGLTQDSKGRLWVGTHEYGITIIDSTKNIVLNNPSKENNISKNLNGTILEIKTGSMWVATWNMGITEIEEIRPNNFNYKWIRNYANDPLSLKGWSIRYMIKSKFTGDIWICSYDAGLEKYDVKNKRFIHYSFEPNNPFYIPFKKIWCLMEDHKGNIWVGTQEGGVFMLDIQNKKVKHFAFDMKNPNSLASVSIRSLFEANDGSIWIGHSGAGLDKLNLKTGKITHFSENEGLCNEVIWSITQDQKGMIWLSTDNGISRLNPYNNTFSNFNTSDGLQGAQFNHASFNKTLKGEIMYGGINGFSIIDPMKFSIDSFVPPVVITNFKLYNATIKPGIKWENRTILNKPIYTSEELHLKYNDKIFSFEFAALDYANPEKIKYAYMMEGFENEWIQTNSDKRYATYTNLEHGTYTFKVKATNSDGVWTNLPTEIKVIIEPPFWNTIWFRFIVICIVIILLAIFYWYRVYTINKQNVLLRKLVEERTIEINKQNIELVNLNATKDKIFSIIAHDLKNPFQGILSLTTLLIDKYKEYSDEQKHQFINQIKGTSEKAFNLLQNLLNWAQTQTDSIHYEPKSIELISLIEQSVSVYKVNAEKKQIKIEFQLPSSILIYADENMISTVLRNLIGNAIKFTPESGKIIISSKLELNKVLISIIDSGIGISEEIFNKLFKIDQHISTKGTSGESGSGLGLIICKEFVEKNGGELIISKNNLGSTFGFTVPLFTQVSEKQNIVDESIKQSNIKIVDASNNQLSQQQTVIIIEDDSDIRKILVEYLKGNYQIIEAENGAVGFDLIQKYVPDLIISDVMMPIMNGFELCSKVKSNALVSHIPIILLTAQEADNYKYEGLDKGADDYIIKPFNPNLLEARIRNLIKSRAEIKKRFQSELKLQPNDIIISSLDGEFLKKAIDIIEANIDNSEFDVELFTKEMGLGRTHFYEKLKHISDLSPAEFIRMIRLKRAAQLMNDKSKTISEIMYMVGFNDTKNFRKLFKEQFGMTPSDYFKNL